MGRGEMTDNQAAGIRDCLNSLMAYCGKNDWAGFDPYDALNSRVFGFTPFIKSRVCRIAITQIMKRLPVNLRPLLLVPREQNPKGIALFLMAFLKLSKLGLLEERDLVEAMVERLVALRSPHTSYWCWGYSFPWQTRTDLVPQWSPNSAREYGQAAEVQQCWRLYRQRTEGEETCERQQRDDQRRGRCHAGDPPRIGPNAQQACSGERREPVEEGYRVVHCTAQGLGIFDQCVHAGHPQVFMSRSQSGPFLNFLKVPIDVCLI